MNKKKEESQKIVVGVDIGGTKISAGLVVQGKKIIAHETISTPQTHNQKIVIEAIFSVINKVFNKEAVGIGIGVPGLVDTGAGIAYDIKNIPALAGVPLKELFEKEWGRAAFVNNDANCFALGSRNYNDGKKFQNLIGLSLGTGLGGGIVINGHLYEGVNCGAGEFGFLPYKDGILEHYCSGLFFQRQYSISGKDAAALASQGDEQALEMFYQFGIHLGKAIKIVAHVFAPEAVILGGSISKSFWLFKQSMWDEIHDFPYHHIIDKLEVLTIVNPDIAIVGAALLIEN